MRVLVRVLACLLALPVLSACGGQISMLNAGQSYALAPDLTVRLVSIRPGLSQLHLQITILATGGTAIETLIPAVVVTPEGGHESSATLDVARDSAKIDMLLDGAQQVSYVTVRDSRNGHAAKWDVNAIRALAGCATGDACRLIGMPQSQPLQP